MVFLSLARPKRELQNPRSQKRLGLRPAFTCSEPSISFEGQGLGYPFFMRPYDGDDGEVSEMHVPFNVPFSASQSSMVW